MNGTTGSGLWHSTADARATRAPLAGDDAVDVVIVGAGYTGLWTAYALQRADPALRIAICERDHVGFGASGRNGGWCSPFFAGARGATEHRHGRDAVIAMQQAMFETVAEIERVVNVEGIDCDWARGGSIDVARLPAQVERLRRQLDGHRAYGFGEADWRWLDADETRSVINCTQNLGALFTPHCAAIHPAKLAHELARVVEQLGVKIYEHTPVTELGDQRVVTPHGVVRADVIVRATEAFTVDLPGHRRDLAPVYSLMIATEPLSDAFWADAGLSTRPTFTDGRLMIIYGQRTADGRFAFGGRGTPYHFGSRIRPAFDRDQRVFDSLHETLRAMFPALGDAAITHQWGGAVAIPRDWYPSVGYDRVRGMAWGGGYVGDGVSTTNLAGRTIADLILGRDTDLTRLPWVGHTSPQWEPEPWRWLGVNFGRRLATSIDRAEAAGRTPKWRLRAAGSLIGEG